MNKNSKTIFFISASLTSIFIILGIITIFFHFQEIKNEEYIKTIATVSGTECETVRRNQKTSRICTTSVNYEVDNEKYEDVSLDYFIPLSFKGMKTVVYYDKKYPNMLKPMNSLIIGIGAILLGLFFIFLEYKTMYLPIRKKEKELKNLIENGKQIYAKITKIRADKSISINGKNPYYASCTYTDENGKNYTLKSESIFFDLNNWFENRKESDILLKA